MKKVLQSRINEIYTAKVEQLFNESMARAEMKKKDQFLISVDEIENRDDFLKLTSELDNWANEYPQVNY
ncbi:hypothetical protein [Leeuwenhoekiella aestuarii]|uniref:Uncharacterized protein n=1 Tax=Leeuwenhoekiella aestuarii TaxID=2249426 RepID=A0A4Q0NZ49_9FLAO|nr:hypothetical protein [Leeuwenhoekiella aestuarii]RXG17981.1 hypothetical protein DSM04_101167 [Leeuwenhoekiella aestuarii]